MRAPRCGNAPRGSYGHECGSPAVVVRVVVPSTPGAYNPRNEPTWVAHYCAEWWAHGYEAADARRRAVSVERM